MRRLLVLSLLAIGIVGLALGQISSVPIPTHKAPEINPGQAISALALLSGGLLIVRRRK